MLVKRGSTSRPDIKSPGSWVLGPGALIKFDKTVFLRKNCDINGLVMCIVVHQREGVAKNKYELTINDLL